MIFFYMNWNKIGYILEINCKIWLPFGKCLRSKTVRRYPWRSRWHQWTGEHLVLPQRHIKGPQLKETWLTWVRVSKLGWNSFQHRCCNRPVLDSRGTTWSSSAWLPWFPPKTTHLIKILIPRHKIAAEIQENKALVKKIKARSGRYSLQSNGSSSVWSVRWKWLLMNWIS